MARTIRQRIADAARQTDVLCVNGEPVLFASDTTTLAAVEVAA